MKRVLVSACLIGTACRYDGSSNESHSVTALLERDDICLIPVCPEQLGGLPTPRIPSECRSDQVVNRVGEDMTASFNRGAEQALRIARQYGCQMAILKERSPSCGCGRIYDGSFTGTLTDGDGVTASLLKQNGIMVIGDSQITNIF